MTTTPKRDAASDLAATFSEYVPSLEGRDIVARSVQRAISI